MLMRRNVKPSEEGYVLLIAMFLLAVLVLSLAVAAPRVAKSIQRDREVETFHRGMQYRRAVQLYYRKFHAYPPNIDALVKTSDIRFLRKKYIDPMTGKDDWKPIMYGQNKTPMAMGFFGQPLAGNASSIAGVGPSGGNTPGGAAGLGGSAFGGGGGSFGGSSFGSSGSSFGNSGSSSTIFGGSDSGSGQSSSTGSGNSASGTPGSPSSGSGTSSSSGSGSDSGSGLTGQTFGGVGIVGFEPASPKQSILVYKKKDHYNEWEFTYDPLSDMQTMGGGNAGTIGQPVSNGPSPAGGTGGSGITTGTPTQNGPGGSLGSGFGSSSMPPDTSAP